MADTASKADTSSGLKTPEEAGEKVGVPNANGSTAVGDPEGIVTNRADGSGTLQREPKPEDYPRAAKVTPPEVQANSRAARVVGDLVNAPGDGKGSVAEAIQQASDAHVENVAAAHDVATDVAEARRNLDDKISAAG